MTLAVFVSLGQLVLRDVEHVEPSLQLERKLCT